MVAEQHRARYRTREQIRRAGGIGNLQEGPSIRTHGVDTRLIAWPGTGFQTEAVHVLTLAPGDESTRYTYGVAEEALLCLAGSGEVFLRGDWRRMHPGDIAYVPEGIERAVRNPSDRDLVLVTQITPPQFDLYADAGFYDVDHGTLDLSAIFKATLNAPRVAIPQAQMAPHDDQADIRAEHLAMADVRATGALFNVYSGAPFAGLGLPAHLVLWPGSGTRSAGFSLALAPAGATDTMHVHPVSDECLVVWEGTCDGYVAEGYSGAEFLALDTFDVILAPCGVVHGHRSGDTPSVLGGFASPPQLDLLIDGGSYHDGVFSQGVFEPLDTAAVLGLDQLRST